MHILNKLLYQYLPKSILLFTTLSVLTIERSYSQTYSLDDFEQVPIPTYHSKELSEWSNNVDEYFHVAIVNGELSVSKQSEARQQVKVKVTDGYLIGEDHGEFGGGLYFEPVDASIRKILVNGVLTTAKKNEAYLSGRVFTDKYKVKRRKMILIKSGNIKDIIKYKGKLYTLEGLAHMSFSYGSFDAIEIDKNSVNYKQVLKLDDAPMSFAIANDIFYLATSERFYLIQDWKPTLIANKLFWRGLYPNSVAIKDIEHIYVGMRAGYAVVNAKTGQIGFYKFKDH